MMYNKKLVCVVRVDGKILRESGEKVFLPFGSEYSIQIMNLHTTKAVISIKVDGDDVLDGSEIVISPDDSTELEGFMKGNDVSHKFKFIEKTQEISDFRGDEVEDGLIKISWKFEKQFLEVPHIWYSGSGGYRSYDNTTVYGSSAGYPKGVTHQAFASHTRGLSDVMSCASEITTSANDDGITGRGGESDQSFRTTTVGALESTRHSMVLQLKGEAKNNERVTRPILVHKKVQCDMCGRKWKSKNEFCGNCGNSLR